MDQKTMPEPPIKPEKQDKHVNRKALPNIARTMTP